jgi:hypothetical protein
MPSAPTHNAWRAAALGRHEARAGCGAHAGLHDRGTAADTRLAVRRGARFPRTVLHTSAPLPPRRSNLCVPLRRRRVATKREATVARKFTGSLKRMLACSGRGKGCMVLARSALRGIRADVLTSCTCCSTASSTARAGETRSGGPVLPRPDSCDPSYALVDCSPTLTLTLRHPSYGVGHESTDLSTDALGCTGGGGPALPLSQHTDDSALWCQESLESNTGSILQGQLDSPGRFELPHS